MSWNTTVPKKGQGGEDRYIPEEGNHPGILVGLIDLGTHVETFAGQKPHDARKVLLVWELAGLKIPGTNIPVTIGRDYTYSLAEKANLAKLIKSWFGKSPAEGSEFNLTVLLGQPCLVNVTKKEAKESGNEYAIVTGVSGWKGPLVQSMPKPVASITPLAWTFSDGPYPEPGWVPFMCAMGEVKEVISNAHEMRVSGNVNQRPAGTGQYGPTDAEKSAYGHGQQNGGQRSAAQAAEEETPMQDEEIPF